MSSTFVTAANLRLTGISLVVARVAFMIVSLAAIIFFSIGVPLYYEWVIQTLEAGTLATLAELGISPAFYTAYRTALVVLLAIGFAVAGIIIFRYKSDEWLALLVAFTLIGQGVNAFAPLRLVEEIPEFRIPVDFVVSMVLMGLPLSCYLFPDGKIQKRWMLYVAAFWFVWLMVSTFWASFPVNLFGRTKAEYLTYEFALLAVLGTGIYAQIHRYRNTDSAIKREQLKWIVFGVAVGILVGVGLDIFNTFFDAAVSSAGARLIEALLAVTLSVIAQFIVPIAVVFSILRYRLYDIQLVINRSLVYGLLIIFLAAVFGGILVGLQSLFRALTGNETPPTLGIVVATVAVFSLFNPTLRISRDFVNKKIFGIELDFNGVKRQNAKVEKAARLPMHAVASIGSYTGLELIARGGMGEIYKANHPTLNRTLAIKVLSKYLEEDPDFNKRFAREAEMMARLKHPNIINIYDYGEQDGLPYIVMEYLTGETLSSILKSRGHLSLDESLPLLRDLASALDYAHAQGIVHRDIKASNIFIEPITTPANGHTHRAVLMDFGIAKILNAQTSVTHPGDIMGSFDYIAPEQIQETSTVDGRADIYAFGVMVYQMLTGELPFKRNNLSALMMAHLHQPPPDPCMIVSDLPENTCAALQRAMAKKPEERFTTASEFASALSL
jgi:tRNA A-37 threonylcarbamoyl transferase component Bud32